MSFQNMGLVGLVVFIVVYLLYKRYTRQQRLKNDILQHLDYIRQHQVLIKPDKTHNTFSGKFAGRRLRFSLGIHLEIQTEVQAEVTANDETEMLWIYPIKHPFTDDKFVKMLEKNRAWTGNSPFDNHYILAGRPRHFANAVIYPAKRVQSQLLKYPRSVVIVNENGVTLELNLGYPSDLTTDNWSELMGLISDIAQYTEAQYETSMFSGITVDESASPKHQGGHVH
jgi:hypothetical protein